MLRAVSNTDGELHSGQYYPNRISSAPPKAMIMKRLPMDIGVVLDAPRRTHQPRIYSGMKAR